MSRFHVNDDIEGSRQEKLRKQTRLNQRRSQVKQITFANATAGKTHRERMELAKKELEARAKKKKGPVYWGGLELKQLPKWARRLAKAR